MQSLPFGRTGLSVSRLGLGTGRLGELSEPEAHRLLDLAHELGVRLYDTAPSYGRAEATLAAWRRARRREGVVVSTKVGYGIPGVPDWSGEAIALGIERAAALFGGSVEVVHLHSCPGAVALRDDVQSALARARERGQLVVAAYAGENEDLDAALGGPSIGAVQLSVNLVDQGSRSLRLSYLERAGFGVIAKRASANAPWAAPAEVSGPEAEYLARFRRMSLAEPLEGWASYALRFSAYSPGVHAALVGTRSATHLESAAQAIERGPLPTSEVTALESAWRAHGEGLRGVV